jgi:hypothetical protein
VDEPVKRLNYFDHQFLGAEDFEDEQTYHLRRRRLHNKLLHTSGIAHKLAVECKAGSQTITVTEGVAVDREGREIVLTADVQRPVSADDQYVTIRYTERKTDATDEADGKGDTRWVEEPDVAVRQDPPDDSGLELILAKLTRSKKGEIQVDMSAASGRRAAGVVAGSLAVEQLSLRDVASAEWVRLGPNPKATGEALLGGSLAIQGGLHVTAGAQVDGPLTAKDLQGPLTIQGGLHVGGDLWITGQSNVFSVWTKDVEISNKDQDPKNRTKTVTETVPFGDTFEEVYGVIPVVTGFSILQIHAGDENHFSWQVRLKGSNKDEAIIEAVWHDKVMKGENTVFVTVVVFGKKKIVL